MRRVALFSAVIAALCAAAPDGFAAPKWSRLRSANFVLVGDAPASELRDVALHLEQFRLVLSQVLPQAKLTPPTPITIVVFAHKGDLDRVRPLFEGKPVDVGGYFAYGPDGAAIAMSLERGDQAYATIYHEFAHLMVDNTMSVVPVWYGEGVAEYYSTFYLKTDGRQAQVGRPAGYSLAELQTQFIPLEQVLSAGYDSPLYQSGNRRSAFYAESWALVHYLLIGNTSRTPQLKSYLSRLAAGTPGPTAFQEAFGTTPDVLGRELADYVRRPAFPYLELSLKEKLVIDTSSAVETMTEAEAAATVAYLYLLLDRITEAEERLQAARKLDPNTAWANTVLGLLRLRQDRVNDAMALLRRGAELAPSDAIVQYGLGYGAVRCYSLSSACTAEKAPLDAARTALLKAVELVPDFPSALSLLGLAETSDEERLADAERHLRRAMELLPGREDYRLHLAQVYLRRRDYAKAQALLGPLSAFAVRAGSKEAARELLGDLAKLKNAEIAGARAPTEPAATPPSASAGTAGTGRGEPGRRSLPVFREVGPSEQRIEGVFEAIECPRQEIIVQVRDGDRPRRFWAPGWGAVEFITYRDEPPGKVTCGPQTAAWKVYLTWRLAGAGDPKMPAGVDGIVVAVEILPK